MILDRLFHDDRFREVFLKPLVVKCHGCAVEDFLLAVPEAVILWVESPLVVSFLLLTRSIVAMRLLVHLVNFFIVTYECAAHGVEHLFGVFEAGAGQTKSNLSIRCQLRPLILP